MIVGLITFLIFALGWRQCGETKVEFALSLFISIAVGFCVFVLFRSSLKAWLMFFLLGLALGLGSAIELFWEVPFDRQCFVALATALFWIVLSFMMGMIAEFICFLHNRLHIVGKGTEEKISKLMSDGKK